MAAGFSGLLHVKYKGLLAVRSLELSTESHDGIPLPNPLLVH